MIFFLGGGGVIIKVEGYGILHFIMRKLILLTQRILVQTSSTDKKWKDKNIGFIIIVSMQVYMTVKWNSQFTDRAIILDDHLYLQYSVFSLWIFINIPSADPEKFSRSLIGQNDNCACIFGNLGM